MKNKIWKDSKGRRSRDCAQYPLTNPPGVGEVEETEGEKIRCHPENEGTGKFSLPIGREGYATPKAMCQNIHSRMTQLIIA